MKRVDFVGSRTLKKMQGFPETVRDVVIQALRHAQKGLKHQCAKPMKGFGGTGVVEIVNSAEGSTYRVVYTTLVKDRICVLHAFKKKSTHGISTPKKEIDLIRARLRDAKNLYKK